MAEFNPSNTIDSQLANLPPEYAAQIAKLLRQQQAAQMSQQMGMQGMNAPTQFTPGPYAHPVVQSPLLKALQAFQVYTGQKGVTDADEGIAAVKKSAADAQQAAAREMLGMSDPSAQIAYGRTSQWGQLQKLAETLAKQRQESAFKVADVTKDQDPKTAVAAALGNLPAPGYNVPPPEPIQFGQQGDDRYSVVPQPGGKRTFQWAPRPPQVTVDNAGELSAAKAIGAKVPEVAEKARNDVIEASGAIDNANKIVELARDPQVITGFGANVQTGLSSLGAKFGFTGPDAASRTQQLLGLFAKNTLAASKDLKGAITEKEYPFLEAASSGSITWTPEALQHLAAMAIAVNHNKAMNAKAQWEGAVSGEGAERARSMWPWPNIHHTIPGGLEYRELPGGKLSYSGVLKNPNPAPAAGPGIKPKLDPNKIYTLEELKKLGY